jgi:hypothetical protein
MGGIASVYPCNIVKERVKVVSLFQMSLLAKQQMTVVYELQVGKACAMLSNIMYFCILLLNKLSILVLCFCFIRFIYSCFSGDSFSFLMVLLFRTVISYC